MKAVHKKIEIALMGLVFLLVLLWAYTAFSKISDIAAFKHQLNNQSFSKKLAGLLLWAIPAVEITTALLLLFVKTRLIGLTLSLFLMLLFTGYIGLVLVNFYDHVPCSCGGVLKSLGWQAHFWFNVFFTILSGVGIFLERRGLISV